MVRLDVDSSSSPPRHFEPSLPAMSVSAFPHHSEVPEGGTVVEVVLVVVVGATVVVVVLDVVVEVLDDGTAAGPAGAVVVLGQDLAGRHGGLPACGGGPLASTMGARGDTSTATSRAARSGRRRRTRRMGIPRSQMGGGRSLRRCPVASAATPGGCNVTAT